MKMLTLSGKEFDPANPSAEGICVEDIAASLSKVCRFSGQLKEFYSVAQHSLLCYFIAKDLVPDNIRLQILCLLHDASEAYISDIPSPFKALLKPLISDLENNIQDTIFKTLIDYVPNEADHKAMKHIDNLAFDLEDQILRKDVYPKDLTDRQLIAFNQYNMASAEKLFLFKFNELKGKL